MIPNQQKAIYAEKKAIEEKTKPKGPAPLLDLQLYQQSKPPAKKTVPHPSVFYPNYVPNPFDPMNYAIQQQYQTFGPPIHKEYNINIGGVEGSHVKTSMLFEDVLPTKDVAGSFSSIGERVTMYEYIKSIMFPSGDGQDVPVEDDHKNLLSHIKFMDMNPYNASRFTNNPYKGLPYGFLLYRSCYPIRHDERSASAICAKNSTGINVRLYRLTEGAYNCKTQNMTTSKDYDEWRDIAFYKYVRENLIKPKVCPNFTIMYGYNIPLDSKINYDDVKLIQDPDLRRKLELEKASKNPQRVMTVVNKKGEKFTQNLDAYQGKSLVCLTEASNYNLFGWARLEYRSDGNVKRMVNSGYHSKDVWMGVLFQIMAALYAMQLKGIVINKFRPERNIFIKDISCGGNVTNHWKYKLKGVDYYIPNHGYLVLIDTNYKDFDVPCDSKDHKLDGKILGESNSMSDEDILNKTFEMFKKTFDPNNFDQDFVNDNGVKPPEDILRLLSTIKSDIESGSDKDISIYIRKYMTGFMNNRAGTLLKENEIEHIRTGAVREFRPGQIVVHEDGTGANRFAIHITTMDGGLSRIITRDNPNPKTGNFIEMEVNVTSLNEYNPLEPIAQEFKMEEANLGEEDLIETYVVN